ncbi:MAG: hypothetical protein M0C28_40595 [Candidatus Moduliflexus flocculans]|nr:hypothetical protein [Candidatus Moduliflexus flocculans]
MPDAGGEPPHPLPRRALGVRPGRPGRLRREPTSSKSVWTAADGSASDWVPVRPVPRPDGWFETVWAAYREDRIVVEEE